MTREEKLEEQEGVEGLNVVHGEFWRNLKISFCGRDQICPPLFRVLIWRTIIPRAEGEEGALEGRAIQKHLFKI